MLSLRRKTESLEKRKEKLKASVKLMKKNIGKIEILAQKKLFEFEQQMEKNTLQVKG